eukprot:11104334-Alexandrium_andersonii.AAC.1
MSGRRARRSLTASARPLPPARPPQVALLMPGPPMPPSPAAPVHASDSEDERERFRVMSEDSGRQGRERSLQTEAANSVEAAPADALDEPVAVLAAAKGKRK